MRLGYTGLIVELEHLKIKTTLIDEMFPQVRPPGPDRCPVYRDRPVSDPPKNPGPGWCHLLDPPKNPGPGWCHLLDPPQNPGPGWCHLCPTGRPAPGTGTGGGDRFFF
jgi:hypothetical protein